MARLSAASSETDGQRELAVSLEDITNCKAGTACAHIRPETI